MKYEEKNIDTLKKAIAGLKTYEAPANGWLELERKLAHEEQYQETLGQLPTYKAPPGIWESIEAKLETENELENTAQKPIDTEEPNQTEKGKLRKLWSSPLLKVAAVTIPLLIFSWLFLKEPTNKANYTFQTAMVDMQVEDLSETTLVNDLKKLYQTKMEWSTDPNHKRLWYELQELEAALQEMKQELGSYGEANYLLKKVRDLENDRSKVLKEMQKLI